MNPINDPLERRVLLAATLGSTGTLLIDGTSQSDQVRVTDPGSGSILVDFNGQLSSFPSDQVRRIRIDGLGGNDVIENKTKRPATLIGGAGSDTLVGGPGPDRFEPGGQAGEIVRPGNGANVLAHPGEAERPLVDFTGHRAGSYEIFTSPLSGEIVHPGGTTVLLTDEGRFHLDVKLTEGDDTVMLVADGFVEVASSGISVDLGAGRDRITSLMAIASGIDVHGGPGDDDLRHTYLGGTNGMVRLFGGSGDDILPNHPDYTLVPGTGIDTVEWQVDLPMDEVVLDLGFERYVLRSFWPLRVRDGDAARFIDVSGVIGGATVLAGGGDDTVIASPGNDVLVGGPGFDTVDYSHRTAGIDGRIEFADAGGFVEFSRVISGDERDELRGFEKIVGTQGRDTLTADLSDGMGVVLDGGAGADVLRVEDFGTDSGASVTLRGGGGNDTILVDSGGTSLTIEGGRGDDRIGLLPSRINNDLSPARMNDAANVRITGGAGIDTLEDHRAFVTTGERRPDGYVQMPDVEIWHAPRERRLAGTNGDDTIILSAREVGDDIGPATVRAGDGDDRVDATAWSPGVLVRAGAGNDTLFGSAGRDQLEGSDGDDWIDGGRGSDRIFGGAGNDTLTGGRGGDFVDGGEGDDVIIGGDRADRLFGGPGNDRFHTFGGGIDEVRGGDGVDTLVAGDDEDKLISIEVRPGRS